MVSEILVKIVAVILLISVAVVLILGIKTLFKGNEDKKYSNKLMQLRVLLQFIAIIVLVLLAYFFKVSRDLTCTIRYLSPIPFFQFLVKFLAQKWHEKEKLVCNNCYSIASLNLLGFLSHYELTWIRGCVTGQMLRKFTIKVFSQTQTRYVSSL